MYKSERHTKILQDLEKNGRIDVDSLAKVYLVSPVTIRKDLTTLEAQGLLKRTHGGAVALPSERPLEQEEYFVGCTVPYNRPKELIGEIAANFIVDDEWIFLGSGTTCYYIAKALINRKNLNVLTNNLLVAFELSKNPHANLIMTGGNLSHSTYNLGGEIFGAYIRDISISKAFVGVAGIDLSHGYMVTTAGEFNVVNLIREISDMTYVVADDSKFNKKQFIRYAGLSQPHALITNKMPDNEYMEYYHQHHIDVFTPENTLYGRK